MLYECVNYGKMKPVKGGGCMEHITVGIKHNEGKVALVECVKNGSLNNIDIKGKCFLLIILTKGKLQFTVGGGIITATAPSFYALTKREIRCLFQNQRLSTLACTSTRNF